MNIKNQYLMVSSGVTELTFTVFRAKAHFKDFYLRSVHTDLILHFSDFENSDILIG